MEALINTDFKKSPIIVGANGGSGTRIVAQILLQMGVYMGYEFNKAYDNLLFTRLFRNPTLLLPENNDEIEKRLHLFQELMCTNTNKISYYKDLIKFSIQNKYYNPSLVNNIKFYKHTFTRKYKENWGWKAPNSMIYIEYLAKYFPKMKYIHVIRHGLDMAYSKNTQQLELWHQLFNITIPENKEEIPIAQLEYWIKSNKSVIEKGKLLLNSNFYLLNYDELIKNPKEELNKLFDFLCFQIKEEQIENLSTLILKTESVERYKKHDISIFSDAQIKEISNFGFNI